MSSVNSIRPLSCNQLFEQPANSENIPDKQLKVKAFAAENFRKYPLHSQIESLASPFEIKKVWLYNEWAPVCQFSKNILPHFPDREALSSENPLSNRKLIESTFEQVRGKWALWQRPREEAKWKKVVVADLKLEWILANVEILYPSKDQFPVSELKGIILWRNPGKGKKYQLYEGNHRISAWKANPFPLSLPAILYIGKPKKK